MSIPNMVYIITQPFDGQVIANHSIIELLQSDQNAPSIPNGFVDSYGCPCRNKHKIFWSHASRSIVFFYSFPEVRAQAKTPSSPAIQ